MLPLAEFHPISLPLLVMIKLQVLSLLKRYWKIPMTTASDYQTKGKELICMQASCIKLTILITIIKRRVMLFSRLLYIQLQYNWNDRCSSEK
jgi:hypothetical protein